MNVEIYSNTTMDQQVELVVWHHIDNGLVSDCCKGVHHLHLHFRCCYQIAVVVGGGGGAVSWEYYSFVLPNERIVVAKKKEVVGVFALKNDGPTMKKDVTHYACRKTTIVNSFFIADIAQLIITLVY